MRGFDSLFAAKVIDHIVADTILFKRAEVEYDLTILRRTLGRGRCNFPEPKGGRNAQSG
jgi:hypothetical protein